MEIRVRTKEQEFNASKINASKINEYKITFHFLFISFQYLNYISLEIMNRSNLLAYCGSLALTTLNFIVILTT